MDDEYVETSDIEELEEWNDWIPRTRSLSPEGGRAQLPPSKRIKLFHDHHLSALASPSTPVKVAPGDYVPETPAMRPLLQTPTPSHSSATLGVDHATSPTQVSESPGANPMASKAELDHEDDQPVKPPYDSQDPLLLHGPPQQRSLAVLPSPFLFSISPPSTPTTTRRSTGQSPVPRRAFRLEGESSSLPPWVVPQFPASPHAVDKDGDVLMGDHGPGIDSLFSSPVKGPDEAAASSPYTRSASPLHSPRTSSPFSPFGNESPSPSSPEPPRSHSEPSSIPAGLEDEDEEVMALARDQTPEIPPEQPYVLRERKPKQLLPYTADKLEYKALTRGHREARVTVRSPSRGNRRLPDENGGDRDEESQDPAFIADEESDKSDGERTGNRRRRIVVNDPLDEIQNTEEEMERRRRRREGKRAEKTQREEERESRRREKEQRKREREQEAAVISRTTVAGPSKQNHSAAGPSSKPVERLDSKSSPERQEDIFDRYERELDAEDDLEESPPRASPRAPQDDAISISSDPEVQVLSRVPSPVRPHTHSYGPSHKGSTPPTRSPSPEVSNGSDSGVESIHSSAGGRDVAPLFLMYPPGLARQLLGGGRLESKRSKPRRAESANPEEDGPLQPGQTRVRKRTGAEQRVIKGDSESELDMSDHGGYSRSPSPPTSGPRPGSSRSPERFQPRRQRTAPRKTRVKAEYESDPGSEVESIDDKVIDSLTTWGKTAVRPKEEVTLIDYMLASTRAFKSYSDVKKQKKKPSKPKLDIVTAGARGNPHKKQALLSNFNGYGRNRGTEARHTRRSSASRGSETPTTRNNDETAYFSDKDDEDSGSQNENENVQHRAGGTSHRATKRQKGKQVQKPKRGLYILKPAGGGKAKIISGAWKGLESVELEEDAGVDAHSGPKIRPWDGPGAYRRVRPPARRPPLDSQKPTPERQASLTPEPLWAPERDSPPLVEVEDGTRQTEAEEIPIIKDSSVPRLLSGIAFASDTYTQKGWLFELISCTNPSPGSPLPAPVTRLGSEFDIPADVTLDDVASIVDNALNYLFDFTNDPPVAIPDPDAEQQSLLDNWAMTSQNVCRGVSLCLSKLSVGNRSELVERIRLSIRVLVGRLEGWRIPRCRLDARVFLANWTAVELSVRIGEPLTRNMRLAPSVLTQSIQLLVNQLLFFGLDSTMRPILRGLGTEPLSKSSLSGYTAELWTRLIHLCCGYDRREAKMPNPAFWQFILASFKGSLRGITPDVGYHEDLWHTVFSLCALSQFNVYGMVREPVNLPACWELVHFLCDEAFQQAEGEPEIHHHYVRYLLSRFFILNERWKWQVVNVASLVKLVVEKVFHPIKFGNLKGEKPDFPKFLCEPDGGDLSTWTSTDPAYVLLLKFVFKAAKEPGVKESGIKKLVSLSEPATSIHFDKEHPLRCEDMDRIINRITAAIVAVQLVDSKEYFSSKVAQIRNAIPFATANTQTRHTLIRGLDYWTHFVIQHQPNLGTHLLTPWLADMADDFSKEWKGAKGQGRTHLQLLVKMVLRVVQKVYASSPRDPEGDFLAELKQLLRVTWDDEAIQQHARMILVIGIDRWYKEHPPLRPPEPKEEVQEESQDLYGNAFGDIDWDGADIPQELGGPVGSQEKEAKDAGRPTFRDTIDDHLQWFLFRSFKDCFEGGDIEHGRTFISTWVGCKLLLNSDAAEKEINAMSDILAKRLPKDITPPVRQTIDMAFALSLLRRYPMAYTTPHLAGYFKLEFLLISLMNGNDSFLALAADYVSEILAVDYFQHPLLRGCQSLLPSSGSAYGFDVEEFVEIRTGILKAIISNLDALIGQPHPGVDQFIDALAESFSAMRQALMTGAFPSPESKAEHVALCSDALKLVQESSGLAESPRMSFWVNSWTP